MVGYLNGTALMAEHEAHLEHIKEENGGEAPERIVYVSSSLRRWGHADGARQPYMNKRIKDFPWASNNTLFYNPRVRPLPLRDETDPRTGERAPPRGGVVAILLEFISFTFDSPRPILHASLHRLLSFPERSSRDRDGCRGIGHQVRKFH